MNSRGKIEEFTDLIVWQEGHKLVLQIYKITKLFPKEETYSLTDQMRRAVVSVTSNIAEGFGGQGMKEKVQFYFLAKGSLVELKNQIFIARDLSYLKNDYQIVANQIILVQKLLQGLINSTKRMLSS